MSRLDVVIFGATGFTGKHAVAEMARIAHKRGLSWGVAGRSKEKLQNLLKEISENVGEDLSGTRVVVADVSDEAALGGMCAQARVLVNCCGPYTLYGEPVVRAAIHNKTHYVDCSAEPNFNELMPLKYGQEARDAGVYVVSACAYDSIPIDLGVLFLQENFDGVLNSVECYMSADLNGSSVSTGSWTSLLHSMPHWKDLISIEKKLYPTPLPPFSPKLRFRFLFHKRFGGWCTWLPGNDSYAVYRTQRYFYEKENRRPVQIKTYIKFHSLLNTIAIAIAFVFLFIFSHCRIMRNLIVKYANTFSCGEITDQPKKEVYQNMGYRIEFVGVGWDKHEEANSGAAPKKSIVAEVFGKNPAYGMTVMGMLYSAIAILEESDLMPPEHGVFTPGIAFSKTRLRNNLQENGVNFEIVNLKP